MINATRDLFAGHIAIFRKYAAVGSPDACWPWTGSLDKEGYGRIVAQRDRRKVNVGAHRVAYLIYRGDIPAGLVLDHLCRNRSCVNPYHLEAVTDAVNIQRGNAGRHAGVTLTTCGTNHPGIEADPYVASNGTTVCRTCRRAAVAKYKKRVKDGQVVKRTGYRRPATGKVPPNQKLSDEAVAVIRDRWAVGSISQAALAKEYGVSFQLINSICLYKARLPPAGAA